MKPASSSNRKHNFHNAISRVEALCTCDTGKMKQMGMTQNSLNPVKLFWCDFHKRMRRVELTPEEFARWEQGLKEKAVARAEENARRKLQ